MALPVPEAPRESFDADADRPEEKSGPQFDVTWKHEVSTPDGPIVRPVTRTFRCLPQVPSGVTDDMIRTRSDGLIGEWGMQKFIRGCLVVADENAWDELVRQKEEALPPETTRRIFEWLLRKAYTGRPTVPPSGSAAGREATEDGSTEDSSSPVEPEPVSALAST